MGLQDNPFLARIYAASPVFLQSAAVSALGARIRHRRYNASFRKYAKQYVRRQWKDEQFWIQHQNRKLRKILSLASETTEHYGGILDGLDIEEDRRPEEQLNDLPLLTSETIKDHPQQLVSDRVDLSDCISHSTSGTTGTPKTTYHTVASQHHYWAALERFWRRGGVRNESVGYVLDALLDAVPGSEFTKSELAAEAGISRQSVYTHLDLLLALGVLEPVEDSSPERYRVNDTSELLDRLHQVDGLVNGLLSD